jgi:hypothetical protein
MSVWDKLKKLRVSASSSVEDLPKAEAEESELPTYSRIRVEDVSIDFYVSIRSGDPSFEFMPRGLQVHMTGEDERGVRILSSWEHLRDGREFFRQQLAGNVQRAVVEKNERADFVREEHVLIDQRIGSAAGKFTQDNFHAIPQAWIHVTQIDLVHDDTTVLSDAWNAIVDATAIDQALADPLVALLAARIDSGLEIVHIWTDQDQASAWLEELTPAVANAIAGPHVPAPRTESFAACHCMISNNFLKAQGIEPEPLQ